MDVCNLLFEVNKTDKRIIYVKNLMDFNQPLGSMLDHYRLINWWNI